MCHKFKITCRHFELSYEIIFSADMEKSHNQKHRKSKDVKKQYNLKRI